MDLTEGGRPLINVTEAAWQALGCPSCGSRDGVRQRNAHGTISICSCGKVTGIIEGNPWSVENLRRVLNLPSDKPQAVALAQATPVSVVARIWKRLLKLFPC